MIAEFIKPRIAGSKFKLKVIPQTVEANISAISVGNCALHWRLICRANIKADSGIHSALILASFTSFLTVLEGKIQLRYTF